MYEINDKELNKFIAKLNSDPVLYDVRCELSIVYPDVDLETAKAYYERIEPENRHLYSIVTSRYFNPYTTNVEYALNAARNISKHNNDTFVLSIEDKQWKACYGDIRDFSEVVGDNPAEVTCKAIYEYFRDFK
jgi:hypothetical protein